MEKKKFSYGTPIIPIPGPNPHEDNETAVYGPEANHSYVIAHNLGVIALHLEKISRMLNDRL